MTVTVELEAREASFVASVLMRLAAADAMDRWLVGGVDLSILAEKFAEASVGR